MRRDCAPSGHGISLVTGLQGPRVRFTSRSPSIVVASAYAQCLNYRSTPPSDTYRLSTQAITASRRFRDRLPIPSHADLAYPIPFSKHQSPDRCQSIERCCKMTKCSDSQIWTLEDAFVSLSVFAVEAAGPLVGSEGGLGLDSLAGLALRSKGGRRAYVNSSQCRSLWMGLFGIPHCRGPRGRWAMRLGETIGLSSGQYSYVTL